MKRVLLLNREPPSEATNASNDPNNPESSNSTYTITLRHYAISTARAGLPKPLRRLNNAEKVHRHERRGKGVPNLGGLRDMADYMLDGEGENQANYTSASESEPDSEAEVEVQNPKLQKLHYGAKLEKKLARQRQRMENDGGVVDGVGAGRSRSTVERRAIKLHELGPRMRLRLIKVEEGLCEGKVMWHEHVRKTREEEKEMDERWEERRREKEERRRVQRENVARKRAERGGGKGKDGDGEEEEDEEEEDDVSMMDVEEDGWEDEEGDEEGDER